MKKFIIIISCLIIIFVMGYYSYWYSQRHFTSLKDYLESSEVRQDKEVVLNYREVVETGSGYFKISEGGTYIKIIGEIKELRTGDIVSFKGVFQDEAVIKLTDYYISKYRSLKYAVSMIATLLTFLCLLTSFRIDWKEVVLVERKTCRTS